MIREIMRPSENIVHIPIPSEYINKNIEVLIFDIDETVKKDKSTNELLDEFRKISKNISKVDKNIDILKLDEDMNSDIF
ncbi:MAG: hypothetical protein ACOCUI_00665 [bacterium]